MPLARRVPVGATPVAPQSGITSNGYSDNAGDCQWSYQPHVCGKRTDSVQFFVGVCFLTLLAFANNFIAFVIAVFNFHLFINKAHLR